MQELYEYSITCCKVRYLHNYLGEVPELTSKMSEGPLAQQNTKLFKYENSALATAIAAGYETGPLTDGQHALQPADSLVKDSSF